MQAKLRKIKETLRRCMHQPIPEQGKWLERVVRGYFNYHAVPTNARALDVFRHHVTDLWRRTLRRRSQKDALTWERMAQIANAGEALKKYKERPLVVYCDRGMTAASAVRTLVQQGFTKVFNLRGGIAAWRAENLPLARGATH